MSDTAQPTAVITGASTGIGRATVKVLTNNGFHVFAGVRKQADADALKTEFGDAVTPLIMDVVDAAALARGAEAVRTALGGRTLTGLFCNAGVGAGGPVLHQPIEEWEQVFDVNVIGVVKTVQAFGPLLGADPDLKGAPGRIVMTSSVGGELGAPFLAPYTASKHAVEGLAKSLRRELLLYSIDVIVVGPGAVVTPIWDKAEQIDEERYANTGYFQIMKGFQEYFITHGRKGYPPEKVGEVVLTALTAPKPKARYAVVKGRLENWSIPRRLPTRWLDAIMASRLGLKGQKAR